MIRINKFLSICGVTSRRGAEILINEKRVTINDITVEQLGTLVDPEKDTVKVDGSIVEPVDEKVYVILNKPKKVMTTLFDPFKRKTITSFLKDLPTRVYPIGRLDFDTEGVLLLTNDGEFAYQLTHPKYQVEKVYDAKVKGEFTKIAVEQIASGIKLEDGAIGRGDVKILGIMKNISRIRITLTEGRKREVKQLCKSVGHPVISLRRVEFGGITAKGLKLGKWRYLKPSEIDILQKAVKK